VIWKQTGPTVRSSSGDESGIYIRWFSHKFRLQNFHIKYYAPWKIITLSVCGSKCHSSIPEYVWHVKVKLIIIFYFSDHIMWIFKLTAGLMTSSIRGYWNRCRTVPPFIIYTFCILSSNPMQIVHITANKELYHCTMQFRIYLWLQHLLRSLRWRRSTICIASFVMPVNEEFAFLMASEMLYTSASWRCRQSVCENVCEALLRQWYFITEDGGCRRLGSVHYWYRKNRA